ncbi:hypothetical protein DXA19_13140 [Firmicutes bacterium AM59-13]|jgi:hypothetical protein|nr:hypothetical protein DXA19_13140 [Firmicutes bacterium AM59-13]
MNLFRNTSEYLKCRGFVIQSVNVRKNNTFADFLLIYLLYKFAQNYAIINGIRSINPIATQIFVTATIG